MADGIVNIQTKLDQKGVESGLGKLSSVAGTAGKAITAGFTAAAGAVTKLTKDVVDSYGQYEQMVGGVEALYKESSQAVVDYAQNAYKTSQFSANEYLELATTFSAQLISDLNGDTRKAADVTNEAINAISDNWSVMGGDIELIKKAYSGFARQNYTMLDNLRLGYAGTKGEMQRLVKDANEYAKSIGEAGNLSMDSFADQVHAIELIQRKLGIAGNAEREAAHSIQGSIMMTKGAWDNLLVAFGDPKVDSKALSEKIDKVIDSALITLNNLLPVIENALIGIGKAFEKIAPVISERLPGILNAILPSLVAAASALAGAFVKNLPTILGGVFNALKEQGSSGLLVAFGGIFALSDKLANNAFIMFKPVGWAIGKGIAHIDWEKVSNNITNNFHSVMGGISSAMGKFKFNAGVALRPITEGIGGVFSIFKTQIGGIVSSIGTAFSSIGTVLTGPVGIAIAIIGALVGAFILLYNTNEDFRNAMNESGAKILESLKPIGEAFTNMIDTIMPSLQELGYYLLDQFTVIATSVGQAISTIMTALTPIITMIIEKLMPIFTQIISSVMPVIISLIEKGTEVITKIFEALAPVIDKLLTDFMPVILQIIDVITQITDVIVSVLLPVIDIVTNIIVGIINVLTPIVQFILGVVVVAIQVVIDIIKIIIGVLTGDFSGAADAFNDILQKISEWWTGVWENISSFFGGIWDTITGLLSGALDGLKNIIRIGIDGIVSWFAEVPGRIGEALSNIGGALVEAGKNIIKGFLDGLKAGFEAVKDFIGGIGDWIKDHKGPKEYDLHLLRNAGDWIMQSLEYGLNKGSKGVYEKIESIGDNIKEKLKDIAIPVTDMFSFDDYAMQKELKAGIDSSIATLNALYNSTLLGQNQQQAEAAVPVQGPTLNFYANDYSPDAIYQKFQQADTYGFARRY